VIFLLVVVFVFFFSSRRRHTRFSRDWSSDVCSSDLEAVKAGGFTVEERRRLAARAFAHTASYDVAVASWFASSYAPDGTAAETQWPDFLGVTWERADVLRYGENPHQRAALYTDGSGGGLAGAEQLHGKEMSYNNYVDADAARRAA